MTAVDLPAVPRVLIAEADPGSRDLLKQVLLAVRCDARLDVCADGQQASALLQKNAYDLILADWELPGIDGLSLLRTVRQQRRSPALPFILLSSRNDSASVREALPLAPTAYVTKPLNMEGLTQRLQDLLLNDSDSVCGEVPPFAPGMTLPAFLERRRDACNGAPLRVDVKAAVQYSLVPEGLDLKRLEDRVCMDPQITAVLIAAANSAGHHGTPVQTLPAALHKLAAGQSMNLILGLALKHSVVLGDPGLLAYAERHWQVSQDTADYARRLARMLELDHERCYSAGILHRLGDLALLRCLEDWRQGGGALDDETIGESLYTFGAAYGSALRARWRLPLELRQLIAATYSLEGGVYARDALVVNLAAQMARLTEHEGLEALAGGKTARLLKLGLSELTRVRNT